MSRQIIFYVEGYAELEFVNEIIGPHQKDLKNIRGASYLL